MDISDIHIDNVVFPGEIALHIAIVYGDFDMVKFLVGKGADVGQRATGRFFMPEDQKFGRKKTTNYIGKKYYISKKSEFPRAKYLTNQYMSFLFTILSLKYFRKIRNWTRSWLL